MRVRLLALVTLAVIPAILVEIQSAREQRQDREQQVTQEASRLLTLVVAEQQRINEGARQLLIGLSESDTVRAGDWAACDELASRMQGRVSGYVNLGIATAAGDLVCSALPIPVDRDMRRRNFIDGMTAEGDLLVGRYHIGLITGEKVVTIALPLRDSSGGAEYVAWANLDLTWLAQHFSDRFATPNLTLLMADTAGTILVRLPDNQIWAGKPIGDAYMPMVTASSNGVADVAGLDGVERIVAYAPVAMEPRGIYVGVGLSKSPYLAEIAANTRRNITLISLSFVLALGAAWFGGSTFIRRPVGRLLDAAHRWQSGDYAARVGRAGGSEIGRLGEAFDAMAESVEGRQKKQQDAEKALATLNAELEQRVKTEVAQREQAQGALAQAQKMDALGQLTSSVAHDFNNLLAAILGNLELLGRRVSDAKAQQLLENAMSAANRGGRVIAQLLSFARERPLESQPFDANALIKGMADLFDGTIGSTITIAYSLGKSLWPTAADASQIEVAVLNLAINARDAMPASGALLIETSNVTAGDKRLPPGLSGDFVMIAISDTGAGMTEEVKARAFEPFYTTKVVGKGTGLGLSMVYGVAKQSGGAATIESAVGKGTTVALFLPRAAAMARPVVVQHPVSRMPEPEEGGGGKIMLVDDDNDVRAVAALGLSEAGFEVIEFDSGHAAIASFEQHRDLEVLVTDYAMPGMNGVELIQRLRERLPSLPAIIVTGYAKPTASLVVPEGLTVVRKPFRVTELVACVKGAVTMKSSGTNVLPLAKPLSPYGQGGPEQPS